ncbi:MAG: PDZ domain-containing protein [Thermodesulfobacteriota bacterium]
MIALPLVLYACRPGTTALNAEDRRPAFLGVSFGPLPGADAPGGQQEGGLRIIRVFPDSAAEKAGLQPGDRITGVDGRSLRPETGVSVTHLFTGYIRNEKKAGDTIRLEILRPVTRIRLETGGRTTEIADMTELAERLARHPEAEELSGAIEKRLESLTVPVVLGELRETAGDTGERVRPDLDPYATAPDPEGKLMRALIRNHNLTAEYRNFLALFRQAELPAGDAMPPLLGYIRRRPTKLNAVGLELSREIETLAREHSLAGLLAKTARLLDIPVVQPENSTPSEIPLPPASADLAGHVLYIQSVVAAALDARNHAFGKLSEADRQFLSRHARRTTVAGGSRSCDAGQPGESLMSADELRFISLARRIDFQYLFESGRILAALTDPEWLAALKEGMTGATPSIAPALPGISGPILHSEPSAAGLIVIGGPGPNRYTRPDIAVVLDPGGDDFYAAAIGSGTPDQPVGLIVDLEGNDRYSSADDFSQGTGLLGVGLLADLGGDDRYTGARFAQGTAMMGIGILLDLGGDDVYRGQEMNQGAACWGMGLLLDAAGDDCYESFFQSQGAGGPMAAGLLLDMAGNDRYYATGKYPSCYRTPGAFQGLSQGVGFGLRGIAPGGIGMLLDGAGADEFEAGDFSQGGGYALGLGLLNNSGSDPDTYHGSRYAQGWAAHSAAGMLLDEGGNDVYSGLVGALQAAAWDRGVAVLNDRAGDDVYDAQDLFFCQGAAAHNGLAVFLDGAGDNRFLAPHDEKIGSNTYHGGCSFSFFFTGDGEAVISEQVRGEYGFEVEK